MHQKFSLSTTLTIIFAVLVLSSPFLVAIVPSAVAHSTCTPIYLCWVNIVNAPAGGATATRRAQIMGEAQSAIYQVSQYPYYMHVRYQGYKPDKSFQDPEDFYLWWEDQPWWVIDDIIYIVEGTDQVSDGYLFYNVIGGIQETWMNGKAGGWFYTQHLHWTNQQYGEGYYCKTYPSVLGAITKYILFCGTGMAGTCWGGENIPFWECNQERVAYTRHWHPETLCTTCENWYLSHVRYPYGWHSAPY